MRAVIYARYSSDNQREASLANQIEVCRRNAASLGAGEVEVYQDAAISGASRSSAPASPACSATLSAACSMW